MSQVEIDLNRDIYSSIRSDVRARVQQLSTLDQIHFAALAALFGFVFDELSDRRTFLLAAPYVSFVFYAYAIGTYHQIHLLRKYLRDKLNPRLKALGVSLDCDYNTYFDEKYSVLYRLRGQAVEWGLYVAPNVVAAWQMYDHLDGCEEWLMWVGGVIATLFMLIASMFWVWGDRAKSEKPTSQNPANAPSRGDQQGGQQLSTRDPDGTTRSS